MSSSSSTSASDAGVHGSERKRLVFNHTEATATLQRRQALSKAAYNYWQHAKASAIEHAKEAETQSTDGFTFFRDFDEAGDLLESHAQDAYTAYLEAYHECEKAFDGEYVARKQLEEFQTQFRKSQHVFADRLEPEVSDVVCEVSGGRARDTVLK